MPSFQPGHDRSEQEGENQCQREWNQDLSCKKERRDDNGAHYDPGQVLKGTRVNTLRHLEIISQWWLLRQDAAVGGMWFRCKRPAVMFLEC